MTASFVVGNDIHWSAEYASLPDYGDYIEFEVFLTSTQAADLNAHNGLVFAGEAGPFYPQSRGSIVMQVNGYGLSATNTTINSQTSTYTSTFDQRFRTRQKDSAGFNTQHWQAGANRVRLVNAKAESGTQSEMQVDFLTADPNGRFFNGYSTTKSSTPPSQFTSHADPGPETSAVGMPMWCWKAPTGTLGHADLCDVDLDAVRTGYGTWDVTVTVTREPGAYSSDVPTGTIKLYRFSLISDSFEVGTGTLDGTGSCTIAFDTSVGTFAEYPTGVDRFAAYYMGDEVTDVGFSTEISLPGETPIPGWTKSPSSGIDTGEVVTFTKTGYSSPSGVPTLAAYRIFYGDGTQSGFGATTSHVFLNPGSYTASASLAGRTSISGHSVPSQSFSEVITVGGSGMSAAWTQNPDPAVVDENTNFHEISGSWVNTWNWEFRRPDGSWGFAVFDGLDDAAFITYNESYVGSEELVGFTAENFDVVFDEPGEWTVDVVFQYRPIDSGGTTMSVAASGTVTVVEGDVPAVVNFSWQQVGSGTTTAVVPKILYVPPVTSSMLLFLAGTGSSDVYATEEFRGFSSVYLPYITADALRVMVSWNASPIAPIEARLRMGDVVSDTFELGPTNPNWEEENDRIDGYGAIHWIHGRQLGSGGYSVLLEARSTEEFLFEHPGSEIGVLIVASTLLPRSYVPNATSQGVFITYNNSIAGT